MSPPHDQYTIPAQRTVAGVPWLGGWARWLPVALPSLGDHLILLSALVFSRVALGRFEPSVAMFLLVLLALQVRPELTSRPLRPSAVDDSSNILRRALLAFGAVAAVTTLTGVGRIENAFQTGLVVAPLLVAGRAATYAGVRGLRATRPNSTVIVGGGDVARRIISALAERREYGMEVIGVVDDDPKLDPGALGTRILGRIEDLRTLVSSHEVQNVIVAFSSQRAADTIRAVRAAADQGAHVWIVPRLFELGGCNRTSEHLWGYPMFKVASPAPSRPEWMLKCAVDRLGAALGLFLLAPVFAVIAAAVLMESGRPLFFRQRRIGRHGESFDLLKFRTMRVCDDLTNQTEWRADTARITRVGAFLRDTGLDEVPQLLNVLRGDMSLVGPRPERPFFAERFGELYPNYNDRHRLPAGVTGWSQIHGLRGDTSIEDRAALDNYYIDNWSMWQDIKIMVKTIPTLAKKQEVE
ncbi:MAG: sugar transferase [Actinomycetota bacterium]|nr:sugar transferase [Actinomycetota bacterium]